jgi:hypothetical protein
MSSIREEVRFAYEHLFGLPEQDFTRYLALYRDCSGVSKDERGLFLGQYPGERDVLETMLRVGAGYKSVEKYIKRLENAYVFSLLAAIAPEDNNN